MTFGRAARPGDRRRVRGRRAGLHSSRAGSTAGPAWEINVADGIKLNGHHRVTVEKIFAAPGQPQHPMARRAVPAASRGRGRAKDTTGVSR